MTGGEKIVRHIGGGASEKKIVLGAFAHGRIFGRAPALRRVENFLSRAGNHLRIFARRRRSISDFHLNVFIRRNLQHGLGNQRTADPKIISSIQFCNHRIFISTCRQSRKYFWNPSSANRSIVHCRQQSDFHEKPHKSSREKTSRAYSALPATCQLPTQNYSRPK